MSFSELSDVEHEIKQTQRALDRLREKPPRLFGLFFSDDYQDYGSRFKSDNSLDLAFGEFLVRQKTCLEEVLKKKALEEMGKMGLVKYDDHK